MSIRNAMGGRIRELREKKGLTQQELAETVGVESPSYISKIERGATSPSYELLGRIAHVLNVELKDLFDVSFKMQKTEKKSMAPLDKWTLRFRTLLKGRASKNIKVAYDIVRKVFLAKR